MLACAVENGYKIHNMKTRCICYFGYVVFFAVNAVLFPTVLLAQPTPPNNLRVVLKGEANYQTGLKYLHGKGVKVDYTNAYEYFQRAGNEGHITALTELGNMRCSGQGTTKDYEKALNFFDRAYKQGEIGVLLGEFNPNSCSEAQRMIGFLSEQGYGTAKSYVNGIKWYRKSADRGNAYAQYTLGSIYENGRTGNPPAVEGVPVNYNEALKWYLKAGEQGHVGAQFTLGFIYENGRSGSKDCVEAVKWYRKAAERGHVMSQLKLGSIFKRGAENVSTNYSEAFKWLCRAANQGVETAQREVGLMYSSGQGVSKDELEAVVYLTLAANTDSGAAKAREELEKKLTQEQISEVQSRLIRIRANIKPEIDGIPERPSAPSGLRRLTPSS